MIRAYSIVAVLIVIAAIGWSHRTPRQSVNGVGGVRIVQTVRMTEDTGRYANVRYWRDNILPVSAALLGIGWLLAYLCKMLESHTGFYRGYR